MVTYTPMMQQYREIKARHESEILFFRMGDFYEMFFEDALLASKELEITLTGREGGTEEKVPMCGVPYHAAEGYIARLIAKGYKVAICEQVEDPKAAKGLVKRDVIKIITPGTTLSEALLNAKNNNYLAALYEQGEFLSLAAVDMSTGECVWCEFGGAGRLERACDCLFRLQPSELLLASKISEYDALMEFMAARVSNCLCQTYTVEDILLAEKLPAEHFAPAMLPKNTETGAILALGYLLSYLHQTQQSELKHINVLTCLNEKEQMSLDASTLRNLEVTRNMRDLTTKDTIFSVLDFTKTAMGGRLLKKWLEYPLCSLPDIIKRQDAIEKFVLSDQRRNEMQGALKGIYDFERILTKVEMQTANARDLLALKNSLLELPNIKQALAQCEQDRLLIDVGLKLGLHEDIVNLLTQALTDAPPHTIREGGMIAAGFDADLDELRGIAGDGKKWLQDFEQRERERTGIRSLKIGYNKVFGYYIEITNAHKENAPPEYIRKQTLSNAERYLTPELKEYETKVLGAQEKMVQLEYHIFGKLRDYVKERIVTVQETARSVAILDVLVSMAEAARRYNYTRPQIVQGNEIVIEEGRHPVVERLCQNEVFVPNDTAINNREQEILLITGPNMAGKSTYMRQVAVLTLMAHTGSFIPAKSSSFCIVDKIFTRVGASDDLATGRSTFMVEMNEVAQILKNATARSLLILDEIGRGTSTFDGMSIAYAVIEYIKKKIGAKTLFATHYHELTEMEDEFAGIKNFTVAVKEKGNSILFLRRIIAGRADKSYGIHVAQLAGLPRRVLEKAQLMLKHLEDEQAGASDLRVNITEKIAAQKNERANEQISLYQPAFIEELKKLDVMTLSPLEALNVLYRIQSEAKNEF